MQTITIKVSDKALEQLMQVLEQFGKDELQIVKDLQFQDIENQVEKDFLESKDKTTKKLTLAEFEKELEEVLKKHGA